MSNKNAIQIDHLNLSDEDRLLIAKACTGGSVVYMAPLDKGLSGSSVWQARWRLHTGSNSKMHVFKIGNSAKLEREYRAIQTIASVIEPGFPHVDLFSDDSTDLALLRQEFAGESHSNTKSLRRYIEECSEPVVAKDVLRRLCTDRMKCWHPSAPSYVERQMLLREALDWWVKKIDLPRAAIQIGPVGLNESMESTHGLSVDTLINSVVTVCERPLRVRIGAVHGDLHAQNVLLSGVDRMDIIDFGWTNQDKWKVIDFVMMECSLKFACTPPHAQLADLLMLDRLLDANHNGLLDADYGELRGRIHGSNLASVASAVHVIRSCALSLGAVADIEQYRCGLIILMASLATIPTLINRVYLLHSLAYHIKKCSMVANGTA